MFSLIKNPLLTHGFITTLSTFLYEFEISKFCSHFWAVATVGRSMSLTNY